MSVIAKPRELRRSHGDQGRPKRRFLEWLPRNLHWVGMTLTGLLAGMLFMVLASPEPAQMDVEISATFSDNACCQLGVSVNEKDMRFFKMEPGATSDFRFDFRDAGVWSVRLDLGEVTQSHVVFRSIKVTTPDRVEYIPLARLGLSERSGASAPQELFDGTLFVVEAPHATVFLNHSIPAHDNALVRWWWSSRVDITGTVVSFLVLGAALVLLAGSGFNRESLLLIAAAILSVAVLTTLQFSLDGIHPRDSATQAVGSSSYSGMWKQTERLTYFLSWLAAVAAPILVGMALWAIGRKPSPSQELEPMSATEPKIRFRHVGFAMLILGALLVPDLDKALAINRDYLYPRGWDVENVVYWDWLVSKGSMPVRDFYFPYGFQYLFTIDIPWGSLIHLGSDLLLWLYVLVGTLLTLRRFTRNPIPRFWIVFLPIFLVIVSQGVSRFSCGDQAQYWLCARPERYLGGLGTILVFAAVPQGIRWHPLRFLILLPATHTLLLEPAQLIYAAPGIALLAAARSWSAERGKRLNQLIIDGLPFLGSLLFFLLVIAVTGQLSGFLDMYAALRALTAAASLPGPIAQWLSAPNNLAAWVYWGPVAAIVLGLAGALATRGKREPDIVVASVGFLGFMLLGKQMTRPGGESHWWIPLVFGPILWVALSERFSRHGHRLISGALIGFIAAYLLIMGMFSPVTERIADFPRRLLVTARTIAFKHDEIAKVNRTRFDESRFANYTDYFAVVQELEKLGVVKDDVWIVSDHQVLNILSTDGRRPFYFVTSYDASPLNWQKRMVAELERRKPAYAVWNRNEGFIDGVPYTVRVPLIRSWLVRNYVPAETVGDFEILRYRRESEAPAVSWWREKMGSNVNIRSLMAIGTTPANSCSGSDCSSYLRISFSREMVMPAGFEVEFMVDGNTFTLSGQTDPHVRTYVLNLDRLWFWSIAQGTTRSIVTREVSGASIQVHELRPDPGVLY